MTLLFFGAGSRGDVQPMLALALRARDEGYKVAVCAAPNFKSFVERFGLEHRQVGIDAEAFMRVHARDVATQGTRRTLKRFHDALDEHLTEQFESLGKVSEDATAIFGGGLALAAPSIAEQRKIPYRLVAYCPTALHSSEHAPVVLPWQGLPRVINSALWTVLGAFYDRFIGKILNACRRDRGLVPMRHLLPYLAGERVLLAADPFLAPTPKDARTIVIRGNHETLAEAASLDARTEAFLGAGEKPVFIGFGSMPCDNPERTTKILVDAVHRAGCRAILSRGWAELGAGLEDPNILVLNEAPHAPLFARCAAIVHHGGAGTTHTAARAGVPQVIVIHLMDQGYWAARVSKLGLGPRALKRKSLDAADLSRALEQVTKDPSFAKNAADMAAQMPAPVPFTALMKALAL